MNPPPKSKTQEDKANAYVLDPTVLQAVNYMYDHEASLEFIIETIKAAYIAGNENKEWKYSFINYC